MKAFVVAMGAIIAYRPSERHAVRRGTQGNAVNNSRLINFDTTDRAAEFVRGAQVRVDGHQCGSLLPHVS
jgi:hypothetical protein